MISALAFVGYKFLWPMLSKQHVGSPGPPVELLGSTWETSIIAGEEGHNQFAVWAHFEVPNDLAANELRYDFKLLTSMCEAILVNLDEFTPDGLTRRKIQHVDLNVVAGGETVFPHDITQYVDTLSGACRDSFDVDRLVTRLDTASTNALQDETRSVFENWGLKQAEVSFVSSNIESRIEVTYDWIAATQREMETLNAIALCIMAMAVMPERPNILGFKTTPREYDLMEIKIMNRTGPFFANLSGMLGSANVKLDNGKCVEVVR